MFTKWICTRAQKQLLVCITSMGCTCRTLSKHPSARIVHMSGFLVIVQQETCDLEMLEASF